ncbi:hypothetical protein [Treponema putidum]|uniref:hypothetical protein n=1 Tax=Treponema putidum TaxID=221027 RepID=UPI003D8A834A
MNAEIQRTKNKTQIPIDEKIYQWRKESRKIIKDEYGLYFYEGMTPSEKIEWIENEIENIKEKVKFLNKQEKENLNKRDIDYDYNYIEKFSPQIKPDMTIKDFQERNKKYIKDFREAERTSIKNYKNEYETEIKKYKEDIKYYKKINIGVKNERTLSMRSCN